jgi:hypothetical protein
LHGETPDDSRFLLDGMSFQSWKASGAGANTQFKPNTFAVEETNLEMSAKAADADVGGVRINFVPKSGGNMFAGQVIGQGSSPTFQASNVTDALRLRGLTVTPGLKQLYDWGGSYGGPIKRDGLWFFASSRWWGQETYAPTAFVNLTPHTPFYTQDKTQIGFSQTYQRDNTLRLTWQVNPKHKVSAQVSHQDNCNCNYWLNTVPSATEAMLDYKPSVTPLQVTWSYPATSRLLFEAGFTQLWHRITVSPHPDLVNVATDIPILDIGTGYQYRGNTFGGDASPPQHSIEDQANSRFSLSYVTGSHAFRVGGSTQIGRHEVPYFNIGNDAAMTFTFRSGVPVSLTQYPGPGNYIERMHLSPSLYASDQWTVRRFTLTAGLRYDSFRGYIPAQVRQAGRFTPSFTVAEIDDVLNWKDINPRVAGAYDLFGNGRTSVRASVGRYVRPHADDLLELANPAYNTIAGASRSWTDANGNFVPDCDLFSPASNGECGALSNTAIFNPTAIVLTRLSNQFTQGWGTRERQWQVTAGLQQQLGKGVALDVGYFRYWFGNFTVTNNTALTAADYSPYCVTAPVDANLPGGGGNQLCGLYDLNPNRLGLVSNLVAPAANFGTQTEVTNALDIAVNARFGKGGRVAGGVSTAQTTDDNCFATTRPDLLVAPITGSGFTTQQQARTGFCHISPPWSAQTQYKVNVIYPLPWALDVSAVYQNLPGVPIVANRPYTSAEVFSSLGRNLSLGSATVPLIPPGAMFEDRLSQIDARLTKNVRFGRMRVRGMLDLYNIANSSYIFLRNNAYGGAWGRPLTISGGRLLKLGVQVDF